LENIIQPNTVASAPQPNIEDRSHLLKDLATLSIEAAHGVQKLNDQQVNQVLSGLVRTKLMSADHSYLLKDRLMDNDAVTRALDHRIEAALKRRGLIKDDLARQVRNDAKIPNA
jgi:hypothetical protein